MASMLLSTWIFHTVVYTIEKPCRSIIIIPKWSLIFRSFQTLFLPNVHKVFRRSSASARVTDKRRKSVWGKGANQKVFAWKRSFHFHLPSWGGNRTSGGKAYQCRGSNLSLDCDWSYRQNHGWGSDTAVTSDVFSTQRSAVARRHVLAANPLRVDWATELRTAVGRIAFEGKIRSLRSNGRTSQRLANAKIHLVDPCVMTIAGGLCLPVAVAKIPKWLRLANDRPVVSTSSLLIFHVIGGAERQMSRQNMCRLCSGKWYARHGDDDNNLFDVLFDSSLSARIG